jgi:hypothetical protein
MAAKTWRERLAALPTDRQEKVKTAVLETLRLRQQTLAVEARKNAPVETLH